MIAEPTTKQHVSLMPAGDYVPAGSDGALKRLARAVIIQAGRDAQKGDSDAREWLTSDICAFYCEYAGVNFIAVRDWAVNPQNTERKTNMTDEEIRKAVETFNQVEAEQMTLLRSIHAALKERADNRRAAGLRMAHTGGAAHWQGGVFGPDGWRNYVSGLDRTITEIRLS